MTFNQTCLGCKLAHQELPLNLVYENEYVTCILDHAPFNSGHTLILPKQHVLDVEDLEIVMSHHVMEASILISKALKMVYRPDGITICQNGGIFNELTHYHMHVIPRYANQSFADFYLETNAEQNTISHDFEAEALKIKDAIQIIKKLS